MAEEINTGKSEAAPLSRRDVVTKAAQVAVTAPAVAVLLNAYSQNAFAQRTIYSLGDNASLGDNFQSLGDDFTSANQTGDDFRPGDDFVAGDDLVVH